MAFWREARIRGLPPRPMGGFGGGRRFCTLRGGVPRQLAGAAGRPGVPDDDVRVPSARLPRNKTTLTDRTRLISIALVFFSSGAEQPIAMGRRDIRYGSQKNQIQVKEKVNRAQDRVGRREENKGEEIGRRRVSRFRPEDKGEKDLQEIRDVKESPVRKRDEVIKTRHVRALDEIARKTPGRRRD